MAARGGVSLLRKTWSDLPELVVTLAMAGAGIVMSGAVAYHLHNLGDRNYMYKAQYTVIRDTDVKDPKKLGDIYS